MTTDLVQRLRALVDHVDKNIAWVLAEAADALTTEEKLTEKYEQEGRELASRLFDTEQERDDARAEAAVLREALTYYADLSTWELLERPSGSVNGGTYRARRVWFEDMRKVEGAPNEPGRRAIEALSQPGPGKALLDELAKLRAVAVALDRQHPMNEDLHPEVSKALAALQGKGDRELASRRSASAQTALV